MRTLLAAFLIAASLVGVTACGSHHYADLSKLANQPVKAHPLPPCARWRMFSETAPRHWSSPRTDKEATDNAMWVLTVREFAKNLVPVENMALSQAVNDMTRRDINGRQLRAAVAKANAACGL